MHGSPTLNIKICLVPCASDQDQRVTQCAVDLVK